MAQGMAQGVALGSPRLTLGSHWGPGAGLSLNPKFIIFTRGSPSPSKPPIAPMGVSGLQREGWGGLLGGYTSSRLWLWMAGDGSG